MSRQLSDSIEPRDRYRAKRPAEGEDGVNSQRAKRACSASMPLPPIPSRSALPTSESQRARVSP